MLTKEFIREKLITNDEWLIRAMKAIFARQTEDEQQSEETTHLNEIGFNAADAPILSSFVRQIQDWEAGRSGNWDQPLSRKQLVLARRKMLKYSGQLLRIAQSRAAEVDSVAV